MNVLEFLVNSGLYVMMGLALLAGLGAVTMRNLFHSGLCLAFVLMAIAGLYVSVGAEFLAMVQVLIYVGAVLTLIIYAIMLTARLEAPETAAVNSQVLPILIALILFLGCMLPALIRVRWPVTESALQATVSVTSLGQALMTVYIFPFEVTGVLLFAVLIGAVVVARKDRDA